MRSSKVWVIITSSVLGALFITQNYPVILTEVAYFIQGIGLTPAQKQALVSPNLPIEPRAISTILAMVVLGSILGAGLGSLLVTLFNSMHAFWNTKDSDDKITILISIFAGVLVSVPFISVFAQLHILLSLPIMFGLVAGITTLCTYALQSMGDVLPWLRHKSKFRKKSYKILDTNVIIDGRVYDVIRSGFLEGNLYIPGFVLDELQHIADSQDPLRRQRGRRGLEVLRLLQSEFSLEVRNLDRSIPETGDDVDSRLVRLARAIGGDIVTNDFNLNRVAILQEVKVLNINELALALKPNVLPRETLNVSVIREGNHPGQGVGYLEDGTMVVVENGREAVGRTADIVVSQVIQTERGRMIFAEIPEDSVEDEEQEANFRRRRSAKT